jgi:hypothetical protein
MSSYPIKGNVWQECEDCDEFFCIYHLRHVHDCSCPSIDVWAAYDLWPYGVSPTPNVIGFINSNEYSEEANEPDED